MPETNNFIRSQHPRSFRTNMCWGMAVFTLTEFYQLNYVQLAVFSSHVLKGSAYGFDVLPCSWRLPRIIFCSGIIRRCNASWELDRDHRTILPWPGQYWYRLLFLWGIWIVDASKLGFTFFEWARRLGRIISILPLFLFHSLICYISSFCFQLSISRMSE